LGRRFPTLDARDKPDDYYLRQQRANAGRGNP
jgi:hypothetical protein